MSTGRDAKALSNAERLTAAAAEMRKRSVQTVREVDVSEVQRLRSDVAEAMLALADEVVALKSILAEMRDITADELARRQS